MSKFFKILIIISFLSFSCSSDDDSTSPEEKVLDEVSTELLFFIYTPQTETTPDRLQYEIRFVNPNTVTIEGFYRVTTKIIKDSNIDEVTLLSTNLSPCFQIEANSNCTISFDEQGSLDFLPPDSIEFVSAEYNIDTSL